jgi:hypothetical protein
MARKNSIATIPQTSDENPDYWAGPEPVKTMVKIIIFLAKEVSANPLFFFAEGTPLLA